MNLKLFILYLSLVLSFIYCEDDYCEGNPIKYIDGEDGSKCFKLPFKKPGYACTESLHEDCQEKNYCTDAFNALDYEYCFKLIFDNYDKEKRKK